MKLTSVRIRMFRNILDSTEVKIEEKVTCLVEKNEDALNLPLVHWATI